MEYYQDLNVSQSATQSEIKKSYRKLAKQYHPDKGGDLEKVSKNSHFLKIDFWYIFIV